MKGTLETPGLGSAIAQRSTLAVWAVLIAATVLTTLDAWRDIVNISLNDEEQSHIVLVPVVAAWMAWARRARVRNFRPHGTMVGPMVMLVGWLMSYVGYYYAVQSFWHGGAVVALCGALIAGLGANALFRFFPAFAVMVFIVPVPGTIRHLVSGPMQTNAALATQVVLETIGVPVERSTNLLSINGHDVAVAEACNGMRMVLALILVSYAFAFSMPLRGWVRILILLSSPLAALLCNIVRLVPTVLFYGYAPKEVADAFHDASGWMMLPLAFLLLLGITAVLRWALVPVTRFNLAYQ